MQLTDIIILLLLFIVSNSFILKLKCFNSLTIKYTVIYIRDVTLTLKIGICNKVSQVVLNNIK